MRKAGRKYRGRGRSGISVGLRRRTLGRSSRSRLLRVGTESRATMGEGCGEGFGGEMLSERYLKRRYEEGKEEGLQVGLKEGRAEVSRAWEEWNRRRVEAENGRVGSSRSRRRC